ncbi:MAG: phosphotransferase [Bacteroidetes bacterium]|nr:phosphotransferase [Bacteroidota bacterium]
MNQSLTHLYARYFSEEPLNISPLPLSGSNRKYFRFSGKLNTAIGAFNPDARENNAFLYLSRQFLKLGLAVPKIYAENPEDNVYLIEDLGDTHLYARLVQLRQGKQFPEEMLAIYKEVVTTLPVFQVKAAQNLDFSYCYPREAFDRQSMMWDLNYFKYYFLKLAQIPFDEQLLEDDFQHFISLLLQSDTHFFMYRDFQSRNIMLFNDKIYFIDYQGGRKGPLAYDLASLLYDAKAHLSAEVRQELISHYLEAVNKYQKVNEKEFLAGFYPFVYIRIMQALGAYGFRGFYEKKEHFLQSIPFALDNLSWLLENHPLPGSLNTLAEVLRRITGSDILRSFGTPSLTVTVRSFSFKKGIPPDETGRYEAFQSLTGLDEPVKDFLSKEKEVEDFLINVYSIVDQSVRIYLQRNFSSLTVNFGCTGGQHRSVFIAEKLKKHLEKFHKVGVVVEHRELI